MQDKPVALVTGANQGNRSSDRQGSRGTRLHCAGRVAQSRARRRPRPRRWGRRPRAPARRDGSGFRSPPRRSRVRNELGRLDRALINNAAISNTTTAAGPVRSRSTRRSIPPEATCPSTNWRAVSRDQRVRRRRRYPGDAADAARVAGTLSHRQRVERRWLADRGTQTRPIRYTPDSIGPVYPASKTALNAMTIAMAIELESTPIKVNAACPGCTKTNLNNDAGTQTLEEGAREPVRLALLGPDGPTGTFSNTAGPIPW